MTANQNLREKLAELAHEQWSGWMRWMFPRMDKTSWRSRWLNQMHTPYGELSEPEKESDRREADRVLTTIYEHNNLDGAARVVGFRMGRVYRHPSGLLMKIVGCVDTKMYGTCFVGECAGSTELRPVGLSQASAENWIEVPEHEWDAEWAAT
jgi:hypothetical protein